MAVFPRASNHRIRLADFPPQEVSHHANNFCAMAASEPVRLPARLPPALALETLRAVASLSLMALCSGAPRSSCHVTLSFKVATTRSLVNYQGAPDDAE